MGLPAIGANSERQDTVGAVSGTQAPYFYGGRLLVHGGRRGGVGAHVDTPVLTAFLVWPSLGRNGSLEKSARPSRPKR